jgi:hypothetical protein
MKLRPKRRVRRSLPFRVCRKRLISIRKDVDNVRAFIQWGEHYLAKNVSQLDAMIAAAAARAPCVANRRKARRRVQP